MDILLQNDINVDNLAPRRKFQPPRIREMGSKTWINRNTSLPLKILFGHREYNIFYYIFDTELQRYVPFTPSEEPSDESETETGNACSAVNDYESGAES